MTTKEFLEQGFFLDLEIKIKQEEVAQLSSLLKGEAVDCNGVEIILTKKEKENINSEIREYNSILVKDITKLIYLKHQILIKVNKLEDSRSRVLMTLRYIEFKQWEEIADIMEYSSMQVYRIHKNILKKML